jgi:MFS family permease
VRQALAGMADALDFDPTVLADMKMAVTEACTNVVVHAYDEDAGMLEVEMLADENGLTIVVRDHGAGIQPRPARSEPPALGLGLPLIVIFVLADVGSIAGGWLAGRLIKRGWSLNRARKGAMLCCALAVVPIVFAAQADNLWLAVALIGLATAGHQGWSANVFTLTSDMFPRYAVASVVGIGGLAGAVGGMLISTFVGFLLQATGSYVPVFVMAGSAYLIALAAVHWLVPRLEPATLPRG